MDREPLVSVAAVVTSIKLAVVAIVGVIVIGADIDQELADALLLASGLIVVAVGDVVQLLISRGRVTPAAEPTVPSSGLVRAPDGTPATITAMDAR